MNKLYTNLRKETRIIGPNPAYSTHSSAEAAHAGSPHITYRLNPRDGWNPDIHELRNKVKYNPNIGGILVVNPDNPTGAVFRKEILEEIVAIAREFDTFVIFDEIYSNMIFDERDRVELADIIGDVPGIAMKGMSKEMPWPGGRCGWIEIYNKEADTNFSKYIDSIVNAKMLEVCSTTHPQKVLPTLYSDVRFDQYLSQRKDKYQLRADRAIEILSDNPYINVVKPKGSFYLTITFSEQWEKDNNLVIPQSVQDLVIAKTQGAREDKRFVYQLIANKGICCVPLSEFNSDYDGIRLTLLQEDLEIFENTLHTISQTIYEYHGKQ
ncbi:MAG: aminotransferase class I/II-fold pyridoxal phosphate-dependent enzyme [Patescibacteria group bacterium]|nr:aminotransferase class I/II-fold pyridoxal phosphate-dependent enzyme [Patescibacteria group bacterium]